MDKTQDYVKVFDKLLIHEISLYFNDVPKITLRQIKLDNKRVLRQLEHELKRLNFLNKMEVKVLRALPLKITTVRIVFFDKIDTSEIEKVLYDQFFKDPNLFDVKSIRHVSYSEILIHLLSYYFRNSIHLVLLDWSYI
jgi:hypothetical protein